MKSEIKGISSKTTTLGHFFWRLINFALFLNLTRGALSEGVEPGQERTIFPHLKPSLIASIRFLILTLEHLSRLGPSPAQSEQWLYNLFIELGNCRFQGRTHWIFAHKECKWLIVKNYFPSWNALRPFMNLNLQNPGIGHFFPDIQSQVGENKKWSLIKFVV